MTTKPNWMLVKEYEEQRRQAQPKPEKPKRKPRKAKLPKPPREPKPPWTVVETVAKSDALNPRFKKRVISHLRYKGRRVHTLAGPMSKAILSDKAREYNANDYTPEMQNVRLYCEMPEEERLHLAAQHSPELPFA